MTNINIQKFYKFLGTGILVWILICGCLHQSKGYASEEKPSHFEIKKIVVVGFQSAMNQGEEPGVFRNSLSGAIYMSEPVSKAVANKMTNNLFKRLLKDHRYDLISPSQAMGVFSSLVSSDMVSDDMKILQKIGRAFSSDAVLAGYIYRWQEREGTNYAVNKPASVAFDLYLIRPSDGAILRKGGFDKTQQSLSENLLDMKTFIRSGGKWMNADKLAELGLDDLLNNIMKKSN